MLINSGGDKSTRRALLQEFQQAPMRDAHRKEWLRNELRHPIWASWARLNLSIASS